MLREVNVFEKLHHENVIDYKHSWIEFCQLTEFGPRIPCLFILMEMADCGNLEDFVISELLKTKEQKSLVLRGNIFSENRYNSAADKIFELFKDIVSGLVHLHENDIIHRDIKPSNLLLRQKNHQIRVLLSDFGECEDLQSMEERERTGATGTLEYMAPELLKRDSHGHYQRIFTCQSDIWSLGMVLYFMIYGALPYKERDIEGIEREINHISEEDIIKYSNRKGLEFFNRLIERMLKLDPYERPSAKEILKELEKYTQKPVHNKKSYWEFAVVPLVTY